MRQVILRILIISGASPLPNHSAVITAMEHGNHEMATLLEAWDETLGNFAGFEDDPFSEFLNWFNE